MESFACQPNFSVPATETPRSKFVRTSSFCPQALYPGLRLGEGEARFARSWWRRERVGTRANCMRPCQQGRCQKAGECSPADFPAATGASRSYLRPKTFVGESPSRACAWFRPLAFQRQDGHARHSFKFVDRRRAAIDRQVRRETPHVAEPITLSMQTARQRRSQTKTIGEAVLLGHRRALKPGALKVAVGCSAAAKLHAANRDARTVRTAGFS